MRDLIDEVKELLKILPGPPGEALPTASTMVQISRFESETGICMPNELKDWLSVTNGPCVGPGGVFGLERGDRSLT